MSAALIAEEEDQKQAAASTSRAGKTRARKKPKSRGGANAEAGASCADRTCLAVGGGEEGGAGVVGDLSSSHDGSQSQSHQFDKSSVGCAAAVAAATAMCSRQW
eukprot:1195159-Prorocentrum_minimum.AAC.7